MLRFDHLVWICRLHDGSRLVQRFNLTHTVGTVHQFVRRGEFLAATTTVHWDDGGVPAATPNADFELWTAYPRKALLDHTQTIVEAQLQNAAVTQSLK